MKRQQRSNAYPSLQQGGYGGGQVAYAAAQQPQPYAYPGAEPAAPYPGMQGSPVMDTAASAPGGCTLTREQLETYLQQSGYGANAAMFGCYFTREAPNAPVYCIACHQPITSHGSGMPRAASAVTAMLGAALLVPTLAANLTARTPSNLAPSPDGDVATVPASRGLIIAVCIMVVVAIFQVVIVLSVGMSIVTMAGPVILLTLALVFACFIKKTTFRFSPSAMAGGGRRYGAQQRTVEVTEQIAFNWCCPSKYAINVGSIRSVESRRTSTRVSKRQPMHEVVAKCDLNGQPCAVVLYRGCMLNAAQELVNWRAYLSGQS